MRNPLIGAVGLVFVLALSACEAQGWGLQPVSLQNNSDQIVVLRQSLGNPSTPHPVMTVAPHETRTRDGVLPSQPCYGGFDVADTAGKQLRALDKVCANETVVYP